MGEGKIKSVFVDRGYRGHNHQGQEQVTVDKERRGLIPRSVWKGMKRRAATEPTIGHLKSDHRLERNMLKEAVRDAINAAMSVAALNLGKLFGWVGRFWLLFRIFQASLNSIFPEVGRTWFAQLSFSGPTHSRESFRRDCAGKDLVRAEPQHALPPDLVALPVRHRA